MIPTSSRLQNLPDRHLSKALKPGERGKKTDAINAIYGSDQYKDRITSAILNLR